MEDPACSRRMREKVQEVHHANLATSDEQEREVMTKAEIRLEDIALQAVVAIASSTAGQGARRTGSSEG